MTVVFSTYHSLGIVEQAQEDGAPPFDLVLCDEAHRTTGIERPDDKTSPFILVHNAERIRAAKRLYMTATPSLYTEGARATAARHDVEVYSMDDPVTYGPEFHRLPFSQAIEQDLLSDYKVVVLTLSEQQVDAALQAHLASGDSEIKEIIDESHNFSGSTSRTITGRPTARALNLALERPLDPLALVEPEPETMLRRLIPLRSVEAGQAYTVAPNLYAIAQWILSASHFFSACMRETPRRQSPTLCRNPQKSALRLESRFSSNCSILFSDCSL